MARIGDEVRSAAEKLAQSAAPRDLEWEEEKTVVDAVPRRDSLRVRAEKNWRDAPIPVQIAATTALIAALTPLLLAIIQALGK